MPKTATRAKISRADGARRERHLPLRMCLVCRKRLPKGELTRFVFADGLPQEDAKQNLAGRGYYVCADGGCREKWLRRAAHR